MKILIVAPRFPYPIEKGDKLRLYHQIRILSKQHRLVLFALSDIEVAREDFDHLSQFVEKIHIFRLHKHRIIIDNLFRLFNPLPLQVLYFLNKRISRRMEAMVQNIKPDIIFNQLIRTTEYSKKWSFPKVLDYMDAFSTGMHNRLDNSKIPYKWIYKLERNRLLKYEREIYGSFNAHTIISKQDQQRIDVEFRDQIQVVPNGVDVDYFKPEKTQKEYDLCFVGNMGYRPNIIAAEYLCKIILPELNKLNPTIRVLLAGARPSQRVKALATKNVIVSGWMEDIRSAYNKSKVFVAPIFTGIGQQNKVLEAMSMEMPCICTSTVNHPIGSADWAELLVADNAEEFASKIFDLLEDRKLREQLGKKARKFVKKRYSWEFQVEKLNGIFEKVIHEG